MNPIIDVAVAVIVERERFLVTRRKEGVHLGGLWEFPGGKRNRRETMEACLLREVEEELGVTVEIDHLLWRKSHPYSDRTVVLHAYQCRLLSGTLRPLASQECRWIGPESLLSLPFPEANRPLLEQLASKIGSDRHENRQKSK
ncbi:MAG: (deoxy)nucleoside triphosphate pyrophosphohydrolase, partial [Candidatus Manganitrophaceae bacterium]